MCSKFCLSNKNNNVCLYALKVALNFAKIKKFKPKKCKISAFFRLFIRFL